MEPDYDFEKKPNCYEKDHCKSFVNTICSEYDFVVISDIIPDSYIYLTNFCKAKVILEITNRFDLFVEEDDLEDFYQIFGKAVTEYKNVVVVENNPYEVYHACIKGVFVPNYYLIRPVGYAPPEVLKKAHKEKHDEIAIIKHSEQDEAIGIPELKKNHVKFKKLKHRYGGPLVLATYKAVVMLPYQVSIMKMMENFRYGVAMLVPTERLFREMVEDFPEYSFTEKDLLEVENALTYYVEWFNEEFKDLFVYFDKWEDLPEIIENTDFDSIKEKGKEYMERYEEKAINMWAQVFGIVPPKNMIQNTEPLCDFEGEFFNYQE